MKSLLNLRPLLCALAVAGWCGASAQQTPPTATPPPSAPPQRSAADLEKLLAPIALYSDPLIATILPASVYPLEIVQAARFVANTNNLAKLDEQPWDENVKAVARIPAAIQKLNDDLSWTVELGETFLAQEKEVMDTIQMLRLKASKAGTLQTSPQQVVVVTNTVIEKTVEQKVVYVTNTIVQIEPTNPQVIYVPTYNPYTVYYPPPAYVYNPYAPLVTFGVGIAVGAIIANNCNWHGGGIYVGNRGVAVWGGGGYHGNNNVNINVNNNKNVNINNNNNANINRNNNAQQKWQPDQSRLASSGAPGAKTSAQSAQTRGWSSGAASPTATTGAARPTPGTGTATARPTTAPSATRPATANSTWQGNSPNAARPSPATANSRPTASPSAARPAPSTSGQSAFGGVSNGARTQQNSNRGSVSRGGGGASRGGGGRGR